MEKLENMQENKINDEELDQVSGGIFILDAFLKEGMNPITATTTEYTTAKSKNKIGLNTLEMMQDEKDDINLSTLEMRNNPLENNTRKNKKIIKL